jgi:hypothetical protein
MTTLEGLTFGHPKVDLAVETALLAYGDNREDVFHGVCTRDRRCLTVAASALHDAGIMSLAEAVRTLGLNEKGVRVTRSRKSMAFRLVEEVVIDVLNGETRDVEAVARQVASNAAKAAAASRRWTPEAREAFKAPEAVAKRAAARRATFDANPELKARMADQLRANLERANAARAEKRAAGLMPPAKRRGPPEHVARKAPYIRRFLDAGWSQNETAHLFDVTWRTVASVAKHG